MAARGRGGRVLFGGGSDAIRGAIERSQVMGKMKADSLPDLVTMAAETVTRLLPRGQSLCSAIGSSGFEVWRKARREVLTVS